MPGRHDALHRGKHNNTYHTFLPSLHEGSVFSLHTIMHGLLLSLLAGTALAKTAIDDYDVLQYIDPLIGSANGGT